MFSRGLAALVVLCLAGVAMSAVLSDNSRQYTHVATGSFNGIGRVNFDEFGYWDKTDKRFTGLPSPVGGGGGGGVAHVIGTVDGGALAVGDFSTISSGTGNNAQAALGVAFFDPVTQEWCGVPQLNLYNRGVDDDGLACGGVKTSPTIVAGTDFQRTAFTQANSANFYPLTTNNRLKVAVTGVVNGQWGGLNPAGAPRPNAGNSMQDGGAAQYPINGGAGRAVARNGNDYYVLGDFNMVGNNPLATYNAAFTVCGLVKFTYVPATRTWTVSAVGTTGYPCYTSVNAAPSFHPRYCGISGDVLCNGDPVGAACNGNPHRTGVGAKVTTLNRMEYGAVGAVGFLVVQVNGRRLHRLNIAAGDTWVRIDAQDRTPTTGTAREGSKVDVAGAIVNNAATLWPDATQPTASTDQAPWRNWDMSPDGTQIYIFGNADNTQPPIDMFPAGQKYEHSAALGTDSFKWGEMIKWGAASGQSVGRAAVMTGCMATGVLPGAGAACVPAQVSQGIFRGVGVAGAGTSAFVAYDDRIAERDWQLDTQANLQFLRMVPWTGSALAAGNGTINWATTGTSTLTDTNGLPRRRYDQFYNQVDWMWADEQGWIYVHFPTTGIYYGFEREEASPFRRRFRQRFPGRFVVWDGARWFQPFGGLLNSNAVPTSIYQVSITDSTVDPATTNHRIYMYNTAYASSYNFQALSGVALYDAAGFEWVDPFATARLGVLGNGLWFGGDGTQGGLGGGSTVNVGHFRGGSGNLLVIGGTFDFIGAGFYGSIAVWDGTSFGHVVAGQGLFVAGPVSANTGPPRGPDYQRLGDQAPLFVRAGTVQTITENGAKLYVGGNFNQGSRAGDVCLNNIASATIGDTAWVNVAGGCNGDVRQLITYAGNLVAGGQFTHCGTGGQGNGDMQNIAWWPLDGSQPWRPMAMGLSGGRVNALAVWKSGALPTDASHLYAAGTFGDASGSGFGGIARWQDNRWYPLFGHCTVDCQSNVPGILNTAGGRVPGAGFYELLSTPGTLWAVSAGQGNQLIGYDGTRWFRSSTTVTTSQNGFNGQLAINVTAPGVIVGNANSGGNIATSSPRYATFCPLGDPRVTGGSFIYSPGAHGVRGGAILHIGAAPSVLPAFALILAALAIVAMML